jgi:hypothetical protein
MVQIVCHDGIRRGRRDGMRYLVVLLLIIVVAADLVLGVLVLRRLPPSALIHRLLPLQSLEARTRRLVAGLTARLKTSRKGTPRLSAPKEAAGADKPDAGNSVASQSDGFVPEVSEVAEAVRNVDEFSKSLLAKRHGQVGGASPVVETPEEKRASSQPER